MAYFEPQYKKIQSTEKWLKVSKDECSYVVDYENNCIKSSLTSFDDFDVLYNYVKIKQNNKYGLATIDGNICIPILYDDIDKDYGWHCDEDDLYYAELKSDNIKFYFDFDFNIIRELPLDTTVKCFSTKTYRYTLANGNTGYFDITGKILFPALYPHCRKHDSFYCFGTENNKHIMFMCNNSIMSIGNQKLIECNSNLLALADSYSIEFIDTLSANKTSKYFSNSKIDSIETVYYDDNSNFTTYGIIVRTNGKHGVINLNAKEIIPPIYDFISEYVKTFNSKDEYYYCILNETEDGDRWGLADINGNIIFDCEFEDEITQNENGNWIVRKEGCEIEISDGNPINILSIDTKVNWNF